MKIFMYIFTIFRTTQIHYKLLKQMFGSLKKSEIWEVIYGISKFWWKPMIFHANLSQNQRNSQIFSDNYLNMSTMSLRIYKRQIFYYIKLEKFDIL